MSVINIKTNGQVLVVFSSSQAVYASQATAETATSAVTLPATINANTTYYTPVSGGATCALVIKQRDGSTIFSQTLVTQPGDGPYNLSPRPTCDQVAADLSVVHKRQGSLTPADLGFKAWTFDPALSTGTTAILTAGVTNFSRLTLPEDESITNIVMIMGTAGGTLTANQCIAYLYAAGSGGALIGSTGNMATVWAGSTGVLTMPLAGGPLACAAGDYNVAFHFNGTTGPAMQRMGAVVTIVGYQAGLATPNFRAGTADTGKTTTAPTTLGTQTGLSLTYWAALS